MLPDFSVVPRVALRLTVEQEKLQFNSVQDSR